MSVKYPRISKHSGEEYGVAFKYQTDDLPAGSVISSGVVTAIRISDNVDVSTGGGAVIDSQAATVDQAGTRVSVGVLAGDDGQRYRITIESTLDSGEVFVDIFIMEVDDGPTC